MKEHKIITALVEECALQRERLFLWAPVSLACGIGLYFALPAEPPFWPGIAAVLAGMFFLVLCRKNPGMSASLFLLVLVAAGFAAAQVRTAGVYTPILQKKLGPVEVTGTIEIIEELEGGKGRRLLLRDLAIEKLSPRETPVKIRLTMRRDEDFILGQRVKVLAQLNPPSAPVVPGGFDFQRYMYFQRIGAVGFIYKKIDIVGPAHSRLYDRLENLRNHIAERMKAVIGPGEAPMSIAFVNGQRAGISAADNDAMQDAGLAHLISISGIHIGLFSAFVFFVSRLLMACVPGLALKRPIKKYAAVLGFLAAAFYTVLAGSSIPTLRTLIMVGLAYLAIILDRSPLSLRLVAFAASVLLLLAPESLVSASFQMSFAAVACLILFFESFRPWWSEWHRQSGYLKRIGLYFAGVFLTTIIATLATAPFSVFHFQRLTVYGLLGNALAVPLTTFVIMPAIVMALLLMPFGMEYPALKILGAGMAGVLEIAHEISALPHAVVHVLSVPLGALVLFVGGVGFMGLWQGRLKYLGVLPLMACLFVIVSSRPPDILVSRDFTLSGYRAGNGSLHISSRRRDRFSIENWERMLGLAPGSAVVWPREGREDAMACDAGACRLELKGHKISFVKTMKVLPEECRWAEMVISSGVVEGPVCPGLMVRDKLDGLRFGAHAVWLEPHEIFVRTSEQERGVRPWSDLNVSRVAVPRAGGESIDPQGQSILCRNGSSASAEEDKKCQ